MTSSPNAWTRSTPKRALNFVKRTLCISKRALHISNRALHISKKVLHLYLVSYDDCSNGISLQRTDVQGSFGYMQGSFDQIQDSFGCKPRPCVGGMAPLSTARSQTTLERALFVTSQISDILVLRARSEITSLRAVARRSLLQNTVSFVGLFCKSDL